MVQGNITIKRVYYVKGLNQNLFSVGQLCDADLEVAFRKSTCYVCDLKGNDLLTGSRGTYLYSITLKDTSTPNPICLMAKASSSQAWLWHRRLSHLNFDTINLLSKYDIVIGLPKLKFVKDHIFSSCELRKEKCKTFKTKTTPSSKRRLQILHMDLCGPMRVESLNGKKYVLVIVNDYSRYTWTHFLRSKDKTLEVLIDFLKLVQRGLHAQVRTVQTDKGTEFLNKTLHAYFAQEGIEHQTSTVRKPEQSGIVEKRNRTLVDAGPTMLRAAKVPLFFWAEAISTSFRDGENLDKMKEKGDACIFVGYSTQSRAYRVYNKRTRVIVETIHVNFDELPQMASDHVSSDPAPQFIAAYNPPLNIQTTPETTNQAPTQAPTVTGKENINQAETNKEYAQVDEDEFINIFSTPLRDKDSRNELTSKSHLLQLLDWKLSGYSLHGFVDLHHPDKVYRLKKALYGHKQAPRMWYDELSIFLVSKGFSKGSIYPTLFITKKGEDILLVQIYVDDIIFGSMNLKLSKTFEKLMHSKFEMSMMVELKFFLGIQIHQSPRGIFINQSMYAQEILKKHGMTSCDSIGTPMATKPLDDDLSGTLVNQTKYRSMVGALITEYQLADLLTKALSEDRFNYLVRRLGMRCLTTEELEVLANESA
ncbi:retrovirus-related pol polyprotein from transposon TNT 1-94 [Tanacetum coccineum]